TDLDLAARYLVRELAASQPRFVASGGARAIIDALYSELEARQARAQFDEDLRALQVAPGAAMMLARAWVDGVVATKPHLAPAAVEAAALLAAPGTPHDTSSAPIEATVTGLLGRHARIRDGALQLRLDEITARLDRFRKEVVPAFRAYRTLRGEIIERERRRLRIDELKPRVMSSFVRN